MGKKSSNKRIRRSIISLVIAFLIIFAGYIVQNLEGSDLLLTSRTIVQFDLSTIPEYSSSPYVEINGNIPYFKEEDYTTESFEKYSEWDYLGRSGVAFANICKETMPKEGEGRGEIGSIKDLSGWVQKRYDNLIKDKYLSLSFDWLAACRRKCK